ncbi:unnamed protein product [Microthlaspi erraticum]|uniref:Uncharacterized protein n=1 Tax=Microthlaspi erraticum TaxID=1685480 RepID=A0A6D2JUV7_9BRAS|nr:unnamed protein product [Microthlaspi erraticum]
MSRNEVMIKLVKTGRDGLNRATALKAAHTGRMRNSHPMIDPCITFTSIPSSARPRHANRKASPLVRPDRQHNLCPAHDRTVRPGRHRLSSGQNIQPTLSARPNPATKREFFRPRST